MKLSARRSGVCAYGLQVLLVLSLLVPGEAGTAVFPRDPDLQRKGIGENVEVIWELTKGEYSKYLPFRFKFKAHSSPMDVILFQYDMGAMDMSIQNDRYKGRLEIIPNEGSKIGFRLMNVSQADAGQYKCVYARYNNPPESETTLFIYDQPTNPVLNKHDVDRGTPVTKTGKGFKCSSRSTSVPVDDRPSMEYTWFDGADKSELKLSSSEVHIEDVLVMAKGNDKVSFYCTVREEGSSIETPPSNLVEIRRPVLTADGSKIKKESPSGHPILRWTYSPGSLEDTPVDFEIWLQKTDGSERKAIYTHDGGTGKGTQYTSGIQPIQGNSTSFGIFVNNVTLENAGTYEATATKVGSLLLKDFIILYVYQKPTKPEIVAEKNGSSLVLACKSSPRSKPVEHRSPLMYTWLAGDDVIGTEDEKFVVHGEKLLISDTSVLPKFQLFTCYSSESNAPDDMHSEDSANHLHELEEPTTTTTNPPATDEPRPGSQIDQGASSGDGSNTWVIIGVVGLVVVAIIVLLVVLVIRRRKAKGSHFYRPAHLTISEPQSPTGSGHASQFPSLSAQASPETRTYVNPAQPQFQNQIALNRGAILPDVYLHSLEKSQDDIMWYGSISSGPCFLVKKGTVIGLPHSEVVLKKINDEAPLDLTLLDHVKTLLISEITALRQTNHEKVVKFLGCCTLQDPFVCITELATAGTLEDLLIRGRSPTSPGGPDENFYSPMSYLEQLIHARDIASGMEYVHSLQIGVLHPHMASTHMLVFKGPTCKVSGFLLTRDIIFKHRLNKKLNDTRALRWLSPETLRQMQHTSLSDVWSYGILLWEIVNQGRTPYPGMADNEVVDFIMNGKRMEKPDKCKEDLYDIMNQCWMRNPENRPDFARLHLQMERLVEKESDTYARISCDMDGFENFGGYMVPRSIPIDGGGGGGGGGKESLLDTQPKTLD